MSVNLYPVMYDSAFISITLLWCYIFENYIIVPNKVFSFTLIFLLFSFPLSWSFALIFSFALLLMTLPYFRNVSRLKTMINLWSSPPILCETAFNTYQLSWSATHLWLISLLLALCLMFSSLQLLYWTSANSLSCHSHRMS